MTKRKRSKPVSPKKWLPCVFCDGTPRNVEHIFAEAWIKRLMPSTDQYSKFVHRRASTYRGQVTVKHKWNRRRPDLTVEATCHACNEGWMNVLDQATHPLLERMVVGAPHTFRKLSDQTLIARWVTKTALMFDQSQPQPVLPEPMYKTFFETRQPFPGSYIWLGKKAVPGQWEASGIPGDRDVGATGRANVFVCPFWVNHFVVVAFIPTPEITDIEPALGPETMKRLWPLSFASMSWPPPELVDADALRDVFFTRP